MVQSTTLSPPFCGPPPPEVPLANAPLVRVLTQVRFPDLAAVAEPTAVAPFQELIRASYPIARREIIQHIQLNPQGPEAVKAGQEGIWRFENREKTWRASLAPNFLALETTRYTSRSDFLERVGTLIGALEQTLNPQIAQRIGLRYIDRIEGDAVGKVREFVKSEFQGVQPLLADALGHVVTQANFSTEEGATVSARWGLLPPDGTTDPSTLEPIKTRSWVLDLDMFVEEQGDFTRAALVPQLAKFAERIYAVFRFVVTDAFLSHYGASK
ncbi:MAG: TIGR04255 family protein [Hyphomicrobiaceae bacterium]